MAESKQRVSSERIKLVIEIIGLLCAVAVVYFTYQANKLQRAATKAEVVLLETQIPEGTQYYRQSLWSYLPERQVPVFSSLYPIKLANIGGADTFVQSVTYDVRFREGGAVLDFDEDSIAFNAINMTDADGFVFIGRLAEGQFEPIRLPAHSPQTLDLIFEIEYFDNLYDMEMRQISNPDRDFLSTYDKSKLTVVDLDITIKFPDAPPIIIKNIKSAAFIHK